MLFIDETSSHYRLATQHGHFVYNVLFRECNNSQNIRDVYKTFRIQIQTRGIKVYNEFLFA